MSWVNVGGAVIGAVASSQQSDGPTQQTSREPWGPAVPWLTQNLKTGQDLQGFYQKNPFSDQQKVGMQNQLSMADQFNGQTMPGLLDFANKGMTSQYQRARGGVPGSGAGYGGAASPAGLLSMGQGPFSAPKTQAFGQIDWAKNNPFSAQNGISTTQTQQTDPLAGLTPDQIAKLLALLNPDFLTQAGGGFGSSGGIGGIGAGSSGNAGSGGTGGVGGGVGGTSGSGD